MAMVGSVSRDSFSTVPRAALQTASSKARRQDLHLCAFPKVPKAPRGQEDQLKLPWSPRRITNSLQKRTWAIHSSCAPNLFLTFAWKDTRLLWKTCQESWWAQAEPLRVARWLLPSGHDSPIPPAPNMRNASRLHPLDKTTVTCVLLLESFPLGAMGYGGGQERLLPPWKCSAPRGNLSRWAGVGPREHPRHPLKSCSWQ